ncbi:MAG: winged helix-turn-helix domain-containing protein [Acidobacteriota bacterium]|nr:winged helix-turn-helix domain-containing protein [Acidobacteriota bacterium]
METAENKRFVYEFGKFVLDPQEKTLFAEGIPVHLPAKEFETLLLLVENNGKALSKDEMMRAVWQDAFVEETNLAKQISRLRKLLNASGEKLIETLPKHGYRFSADVRRTIQVAEEPVIIEKRTVKRLTVRVENEFEDEPPLALPPKRKRFSRLAAAAILGLIVLSASVLVWFWHSQKQIVKPDDGGIVFLTDASHEDSGAHWVGENQIYFSRHVSNTRSETWRMNADGTNQHRAHTEIKNLHHGRWSPDGKKVIFRKENDKNIYLADANGANEIVLPFVVGMSDWSPDGSQFAYQAKNEHGTHQIFLYTLETAQNVNLTNSNFGNADPSFSPDGKQIAFVSWRDGNAEIYVMNVDGSNARRLTNHPAFDNFPSFAHDGTAIAFQSNRENERTEIYLQNLEGDLPPVKIASHNGETGISPRCWSADGTQILLWTNQNGKGQIVLSNVEPYPARLVLSDEKADLNFPRLAPDGKQILYEARLADRSIVLRLTNSETKKQTTLLKTTPDYPPDYLLSPAWSPDATRIAFVDKAGGNSEIFIINTDGTGLKNLTNDPLPDSNPVFSPDGSEIIFTRNFYGTARLYRMNLDGGSQRRVTEKGGYDMGAAFSPDGSTLAFSGDRQTADSRGLDIFLLDFNNPANEKRLTARRFHESFPAFSPDGKRIAFVSGADGNAEIYLMNSDGAGLLRLTRSKAEESAPQFSRDGKNLIFASNRNGKFAFYEIELP